MGQLDLIRKAWDGLSPLPGGKWIFSQMVGRAAPYTGTIGAKVESLEKGRAVVSMRDRPGLRNHLRSVHAVALANLVELTGNVALAYSIPEGSRFIVTGMEIDYVKKARGTITGEGTYVGPAVVTENIDGFSEVILRDSGGDVVVRGRCKCRIGPDKS